MPDTCPTLRRDGDQIVILDQTRLPWRETFVHLDSLDAAAAAIRDMQVRGAPLIGATAAFGIALALRHDASDAALQAADTCLRATRPTAVNLHWALDRMQAALRPLPAAARSAAAWAAAEDIRACAIDVAVAPTIMRSEDDRVALAQAVLDLAERVRAREQQESASVSD